MAHAFFQIRTTVNDRKQADGMVRSVVTARLASCGQVSGPIESTYWWKGRLETETEWVCVFKTTAQLAARLKAFLSEIHPYEVPEIIGFEMDLVSEDYSDWIDDETEE